MGKKRSSGLLTDTVDIHHMTAYEVLDAPYYLWHTAFFIRADPRSFAFNSHKTGAASRTMAYKRHRRRAGSALRNLHTGNFGYDFAAFLHIKHIVLVYIESAHYILVVHRCSFYNSTRQQHRLEIGNRSDDAHAADIERHEPQTGKRAFGREFIRYRPSGRLGREPEIKLLSKRVYFEHKAVGRHRQSFAGFVPIVYIFVDFVD